ncbi:hypothetical protein, partial [Knoellia aerolata]|uniref:hypothetical protein n=1 Tax=Knoellia aerolata TaxID=442954 RepID=UPI001B805004
AAAVAAAEEAPPVVSAPPVAATPAPIDQPVVRARRKRGRVVAPAGPPRATDLDQPEGDR